MTWRRRIAIAAAVTVVTVPLVIFVITREAFLKPRLIAFASGQNLVVDVDHVRVRGRSLIATGVLATWGKEGEQRLVRVKIDRIVLRPAWWRLLYFRFRVARLDVSAPQITMIDADDGKPSPPPKGAFAQPHVEVDDFRVAHGTFTFVRTSRNTRAVIALREIDARVAAFGTSKDRRDDPVTGEVTAQLGFSGETKMTFTARPTAEEVTADVDIVMKNQNLRDLSDFFEPNVGLRIVGVMREGRSSSRVRGPHLTTKLNAHFDHLKLQVVRTPERGAWATFATNFGLAVGMKKDNAESPRSEQTRTVQTERDPDDSLISFFLRGLKDAAMSAALKPVARKLTE